MVGANGSSSEISWIPCFGRSLRKSTQTCTLLTANLPTSVGHLYSFATRKDPSDISTRYGLERAANTAALMRESAFKSTIFVGVPRVSPDQAEEACAILSLAFGAHACSFDFSGLFLRLSSVWQSSQTHWMMTLRSVSQKPSPGSCFIVHFAACRAGMRDDDPPDITRTEDVDTIVARGRILWDSIYEPHAVKLHDKLSSYHPDFMGKYMCTHIATFFVPPTFPSPLPISFVSVCSGSLRPTATLHSPYSTPTPAPRFTLGFPR